VWTKCLQTAEPCWATKWCRHRGGYWICAEFYIVKYMLRLKLVNIYPLNFKLTEIWDRNM
jgi:hypothetical protein